MSKDICELRSHFSTNKQHNQALLDLKPLAAHHPGWGEALSVHGK
jgi:hypothetical protein